MEILYNLSVCQPVGNVKRHGGGIYGEIVFKRIVERGLPVSCYFDAQKWLNPEISELIHKNNIPLYDSNEYTLNDVAIKTSADLFYSPMNTGFGGLNGCPCLVTIHGLRKLELPKDLFFFKYKSSIKDKLKFVIKWIRTSHDRAIDYEYRTKLVNSKDKMFITVSEHSRDAFKSYYPLLFKDKDIPVFYSPSTIGNICINKRHFNEKFFLIVSAGIWAKNPLRAIIALDRLFSSGMLQDYCVRITGVSDPSIYKYNLQNPNKFHFMGYVDDDVLHQLFHDAYCLIYPSLNEGFGYPPVEAMSFGVPVIASSFSSISEICQNAALYLNPYSIEEIMNRIIKITRPEVHFDYSERARKRYTEVYKRQKEDLDGLIDYMYKLSSRKTD